ncbi:MAG: hypothetical protein ACLFMX_01940 [Halobacteriales archaeon]
MGARDPTSPSDDVEVFNPLGTLAKAFVPQHLAQRALSVAVSVDPEVAAVDEPVEVAVTLRNRLPLPVALTTAGGRLWGWSVDGAVSARAGPRRVAGGPRTLELDARERRTLRRTWRGRIRQPGPPRRWEPVAPGEHEVVGFVDLSTRSVVDRATVRIR